jgi:hypothetical protein
MQLLKLGSILTGRAASTRCISSTGRMARRMTVSATLPKSVRAGPVRACAFMMMMMMMVFELLVNDTIACAPDRSPGCQQAHLPEQRRVAVASTLRPTVEGAH